MPHYRFNVYDGRNPIIGDPIELPDHAAARKAAAMLAGEMLKEASSYIWSNDDWHVDVTDVGGAVLCSLSIKAVVDPTLA